MFENFPIPPKRPVSFCTMHDAANLLQVSQRTVIRWIRDGKLKAFKLGNTTRIAVSDLEQFLIDNTEVGAGSDVIR